MRRQSTFLAGISGASAVVGGLLVAGHPNLALTAVAALIVALVVAVPGVRRLRSALVTLRHRERGVFRAWDQTARGEWFYWQQRLVVDAVLLAAVLLGTLLLRSCGLEASVAVAVALAGTAGLIVGELVLYVATVPQDCGVDG